MELFTKSKRGHQCDTMLPVFVLFFVRGSYAPLKQVHWNVYSKGQLISKAWSTNLQKLQQLPNLI